MRTTGKRKISYTVILLLVVIGLVVGGCVIRSNQHTFHPVDNTDKSMTVPPGSFGALFHIKTYLKNNGWITKIYRGPTRTQGITGQNTDVQTYDTFKTRYTLFFYSRRFDICVLSATPAVSFDLSIVDNQSGEEAYTASGNECENNIVNIFKEWVEGRPTKK